MQIEYIPLEQLGFVGRGKSKHRPRNDESLYGGEYPFIQTADVKKAELYIREYSQTYNEKGLAQSKLWPKGTLCLTIAANIADTAILDMEACFPDSIIGFIADETKVNVKYVKYFYSLFQRNLQKISQGAAQDNLNLEKLLMYPIPCPSLDVQNRIVGVLGTIDDLLVCNSDLIDHHKLMVEKLYHEWFINFKFSNHEQVKFVDGIPEGWTNVSLKEVISTNPSTLKKGELDEILYVDISSVGQGKIESFTQYHIDDAPGRAKRKVQHGDVIWSCVRPNRKQYALIQNPQSHLIVSTGFTVLRPTKIPFTYLTALAASDDFCGYLTSVAQGAAYPAVTYKDFEDYEFLLPPKSLLDKFHEVVELMYEQMHILQIQNQKLQDLKEILLPRLMSGELDVSKISSIE
ncbi:restriction endonuclease subunit S [Acinetobacter terrestris]|uniref:restriction endonuclease subunit S n=1 Tax=Acinetobacter terrestris TaxID=2529843 RepID=UPI00103AF0AE|nr:restriction endonuclease subunit S [Acinetobacter terrestris]TCB57509.1 restriction endonuclease subunit S [Acinetobacter terrestris]